MASRLDSHAENRPTLDPFITLQVPLGSSKDTGSSNKDLPGSRFSVASVCFLPSGHSNNGDDYDSKSDSDSSSDNDEDVVSFRCRDLVKQEKRHDGDAMADSRDTAASLSLSGTRLVSSHTNGDAFVWDLGRRRIVGDFCNRRRQGMALRRLGESSNNILFQTRDPLGTVSIHDSTTTQVVTSFETYSLTFCTAAPCHGNDSVIVLPTENRFDASVRDIRVSPTSPPIVRFHGAGLDENEDEDKHGMLTSIAMSEANDKKGRPVVACGMESGTVCFHDLRMPGASFQDRNAIEGSESALCSMKLGKDPVLGVDLAPSAPTLGNKRSFVSIAGMAGEAADLSELPVEERGTVAVIKTFFANDGESTPGHASTRLRARVATCEVSGPDESFRGGKPGASVCRFRPDGRVFGVGGWDRRVRIFDRLGKAAPLAILKGHGDSVTALDWAPDSQTTGFLATGAGDGRIYIWRCFPSS